MKVTHLLALALCAGACSGQPASSLGDLPVREIRCPTFLDDETCLARARRECGTERITVLSAPPKDESIGVGTTVPIEGQIHYRLFVVRCEE